MAEGQTYTAMQIAMASRELREAAGAEEQRFTAAEAIEMLDDEIRLLREPGLKRGIFSHLSGFSETSQAK
jgi:hypothetical protein